MNHSFSLKAQTAIKNLWAKALTCVLLAAIVAQAQGQTRSGPRDVLGTPDAAAAPPAPVFPATPVAPPAALIPVSPPPPLVAPRTPAPPAALIPVSPPPPLVAPRTPPAAALAPVLPPPPLVVPRTPPAAALAPVSPPPAPLAPSVTNYTVKSTAPSERTIVDPNVQQASCCGYPGGNGAAMYGCANNNCVPGRPPSSSWCNSDSCFGRLLGGACDGICWADPCYEPRWILEANAAFFADSPRPVTQTRIRWDAGINYIFPDTSEFFWAKIGGKGPANKSAGVRYDDLTIYQEIAASKTASVFFDMLAYRSLDPSGNPSAAGFGDINVGVKTVLLDRELLLASMQLKTTIPTAASNTGLGIGHVALEPSLLMALKLTPNTYLQSQLAEWIPFGGTAGFAGSVFHYHFSLNHKWYQKGDFLSVVGTVELNGYTFRGMFTDFPSGLAVDSAGTSYVNIGPGVRVMLCDKVDFGVGMGFDITNGHGPAQIYRTELRMRF